MNVKCQYANNHLPSGLELPVLNLTLKEEPIIQKIYKKLMLKELILMILLHAKLVTDGRYK